jgi:GNAT superfamily N-acetyltransferase
MSAAAGSQVEVRAAAPGDVGLIMTMIAELAEYERLADEVRATDELLDRALFGSPPSAEALIAERGGEPIGYALYFRTFSTFLAIQGIWLEDLYVRPEHRKGGAGKALLAAVAARLRESGGERLEWAALDWNELALGFYRGLGAQAMNEWITHRLIGDDLASLAAEAPPLAGAPRR